MLFPDDVVEIFQLVFDGLSLYMELLLFSLIPALVASVLELPGTVRWLLCYSFYYSLAVLSFYYTYYTPWDYTVFNIGRLSP